MKLSKIFLITAVLAIFCYSCSQDDPDDPDPTTGNENPTNPIDPDPTPDNPPPTPIISGKTCETVGNGKLYEVGPGKTYEKLIDVPTESLGPGDVVKIYAKDDPYYERLVITTKGTELAPICICGVPDSSGRLPVLDGTNSRVRPIDVNPYFNDNTVYGGVIVIGRNFDNHPEYINISNLQIQGAHQFNQDDAQKTYKMGTEDLIAYGRAASGINLRGSHFEISNCIIQYNGNGIFGAYNGPENQLEDVKLYNNIIKDNGTNEVDRQHNVYIESNGLIAMGNRIGPIREGSRGTNYKSRSAGDQILYNRFVGPAGRQLNLAETENGYPHLSELDSYQTTYVIGNIIEGSANGAGNVVHYGHDINTATVTNDPGTRQGSLYVYNNTLVLSGLRSDSYRKTFFDITVCEAELYAFNNILYYENDNPSENIEISILRSNGSVIDFSNNLVTQAALASYNTRPEQNQNPCPDKSLSFDTVEPMMIANQNFGLNPNDLYKLTANSDAINAGMEIPANLPKVEYQFKSPNGIEERAVNGTIDIGAFEF